MSYHSFFDTIKMMNRYDLEGKSNEEVKKLADEGHYAAIMEYGLRMMKEEKYQEAFNYLYSIKNYDNSIVWSAIVDIADYYMPGLLPDKEIFQLLVWIHSRVHNYYTYKLAYCYRDGRGTRRSLKKYIELLTEAMNDGSHYAAIELAECYEKGFGVRQSYRKAFHIYYYFYDEHCKPDHTCAYRAALYMLEGKGGAKRNMNAIEVELRFAARVIREARPLYKELFGKEYDE